jgi:magnesium transporter
MYAASGVHRLVPVKDSLQDFEMQVKSALKCLTDLLEDDQDMLGMLLTEKMEARQIGTQIEHMRHESVELLLEEYTRQLTNVLQETNFLLKKVQSQQELVAISLDAFRNRMIRMNLYLSIASVGIASSTAIAGYYGMNLIHGLEDNPTAFINVVSGTTFAGLLFGGGCIAYIRGASSNARSMERLREIEVIDGALSPTKMGALDYTMKILAENKVAMTKHDFRDKMMASDQLGMIPEKELDLLFGALDITKDGFISTNDFRSLADLGRKVNLEIQSDGDGK